MARFFRVLPLSLRLKTAGNKWIYMNDLFEF